MSQSNNMLISIIDLFLTLKLTISIDTKLRPAIFINEKMFHTSFFNANSFLNPCFSKYGRFFLLVILESKSDFTLHLDVNTSVELKIFQLLLNDLSTFFSTIFINDEVVSILLVLLVRINTTESVKSWFLLRI